MMNWNSYVTMYKLSYFMLLTGLSYFAQGEKEESPDRITNQIWINEFKIIDNTCTKLMNPLGIDYRMLSPILYFN